VLSGLSSIGTWALRQLDPERAHQLTIKLLKTGLSPAGKSAATPGLAQQLLGLTFSNPLGIAAGFDKNGEAAGALAQLGFGFVEVGTTTPLPQSGNPRPRIFRLPDQNAVINRLGFNNDGHAAMLGNLEHIRRRTGPIGVNIGANKLSDDRISDYVQGIEKFAHIADYFTVNISSPNTPGLRDLQAKPALEALLTAVLDARQKLALPADGPPILLKISPDIAEQELADIVDVVMSLSLDGMIVSNTTLDRRGLTGNHRKQAGGLSGVPLFARATAVLARTRQIAGPDLLLVGVGGVDSAEAAWQKIGAGANLIQLYSALIYHGPALVPAIVTGLAQRLRASPYNTLGEAVGHNLDDWSALKFPDSPAE
jgi:dihydroorotate dehydrogenase